MTGPLQGLLVGPSWLYRAGLVLRDRYYDRPSAVLKAGVPVISVGNLTVGGTGKTPVVAWIARTLVDRGRRPAVVSRGYGGTAGRGPVLVSSGGGPLCDARVAGDEPALLAETTRGVTIVVGSDRHRAALRAQHEGADVVILDDGFQHRRLARDLDLVLVDSTRALEQERLLPAGRLREPLTALRRADIVLISRSGEATVDPLLVRTIRRHHPAVPILATDHRVVGFRDASAREISRPDRVLAFCGIGHPQRFRQDLQLLGLELVDFRAFRDHHAYRRDELRDLAERAATLDAALVTTEKDLVRLAADGAPAEFPRILAMKIEAVIHQPDSLIRALSRVLESSGP